MCFLYGYYLNINPSISEDPARDRFILSKGHGVLGYFPVLNYYGFISNDILNSYKTFNSKLIAHPIKDLSLGIESSNGSLGHGLSYGTGIAYGLLMAGAVSKVVVLVGDGECNEGSVWESIMSAATLKLHNLFLVVDFNSFQSDGSTAQIIQQDNLAERIESFGWCVQSIDGHSYEQISAAFTSKSTRPKAIIANTIKGKGIDFMENNNSFHHASLTESTYQKALASLYASSL